MKKTKKQFKEFVSSCVNKIMDKINLEDYHGKIIYEMDKDEERNCTIFVDTDVRRFELYIYRGLYEIYQYDPESVMKQLCHDIAYIHTHDLFKLVMEPFKTEREVRKTDVRLAQTIGSYLYRLTWGKE